MDGAGLKKARQLDGDPVTLSGDGVTQDEPVVSRTDNTSPDAVDQGDGQLRVRAERNPHGDGRVYRIAFTASDGRGGLLLGHGDGVRAAQGAQACGGLSAAELRLAGPLGLAGNSDTTADNTLFMDQGIFVP